MIKSFVGVEAASNPAIFEDLFRLRDEIYIVRRKWGALRAEDGLERDSYDNSDAVYLIGLSGEGKVNCGLRLLPTTLDHLFRDHFLHLAPAGLPQGDGVYELTRFFIATTRVAARHRQRMIAILGAALFEYCLAHGIETIICVTDAFLIPTMQSLHWRPRPLGLPSKYPEGTAVGVAIEYRKTRSTACERRTASTAPFSTSRSSEPCSRRRYRLRCTNPGRGACVTKFAARDA